MDEEVKVSYIHDGDTVRLADGRRVRFAGINTPEIGRDGKPSQPLAEEARDALRDLLGKHPKIGLHYDAARQDAHGRTLAHIFANGQSVEAVLLERGLATRLTVPPSLEQMECYRTIEQRARAAHRGVWALPGYQVIDASRLPADTDGFRLIRGRVIRTGDSRCCVWINLEGGVALRIEREDLKYFQGADPSSWRGREVIARGWMHRSKKRDEWSMHIRHPVDVEFAR